MTLTTTAGTTSGPVCRSLQPAGAAPSRPVVGGDEDGTSNANKIVYLHARTPLPAELRTSGDSPPPEQQSAGVCRNNTRVVVTTVCTHGPCVCVYLSPPRVGAGTDHEDQTTRGRRVSTSTHTRSGGSSLLLLLCLSAKLHTHTSHSRHVCVQSVGTLGVVSS